MYKDRFISFLKSLDVEEHLFEAIITGYDIIFTEAINSWDPNVSPITQFTNPVGEPMGSYNRIMKQLPSPIGGFGNAADAGSSYDYAPSENTRDIAEETKEEWDDAPKFPKIKHTPDNTTKRIIKKAKEHIPTGTENTVDQVNYYTNAHMGMYDMDYNANGIAIPPR
jgi:hypothetical protein